MRKLRVLMISQDFPPRLIGGIGRHTQDLYQNLSRLGIIVTLVVPKKEGEPSISEHDVSRIIRVPHIPLETPREPGIGRSIWEPIHFLDYKISLGLVLGSLSHESFDLIHCHDAFASSPCLPLAEMSRLPLIVTKHFVTEFFAEDEAQRRESRDTLGEHFNYEFMWALERRMLARADGIIAVSSECLDYARRYVNNDKTPMCIIPNGTDFHKYIGRKSDAQAKRATICVSSDKLILLPGRLIPRKGGKTLLKAIHRMRRKDVQVLFVGDGREGPSLKALAVDLGISDQVHFVGHQEEPDIADWYLAADVVVLPSFLEGLPLALLEAMALGKPVIGTSIGGIENLVVDGENGLLVTPGDEGHLANALSKLINNPENSWQMGRSAEATIRRQYTCEHIVQQTVEFYEHVLLHSKGNR